MVIIFYDANARKIHICTEHDRTKVIDIDDPRIMDYIPNDDILWVQDAHFVTKQQFGSWLMGDNSFVEDDDHEVTRFTGFLSRCSDPSSMSQTKLRANDPPSSTSNKLYIHPTANGAIRIEDVHSGKFPDGIELVGKWDFLPIDDISEELEESYGFKVLLGKGKIEIVDERFYQANKHKAKKKVSPAQMSLDSILVPADIKAATMSSSASSNWDADTDEGGALEILAEP